MMQVNRQHPKSTQGQHATDDAVGDLERMAHGLRLVLSLTARRDIQRPIRWWHRTRDERTKAFYRDIRLTRNESWSLRFIRCKWCYLRGGLGYWSGEWFCMLSVKLLAGTKARL